MAFANLYTHRKVAEPSARSCEICFKPSPSVLITPDNKDFFYVCTQHLKDANFCTPKIDQAALDARKKKRELDEEVARVKKEYDEKQRKKKEKEDEKEKDKEKKDGKEKEKENDEEKKKVPDGDAKEPEPDTDVKKTDPDEDEPRVFILKPSFYQLRLGKKRQIELAKRNRERMQDPNFFPSVPQNLP